MPNRLPLLLFVCAFWLLMAAAGLVVLTGYEQKPGAIGETPSHWPSEAGISLDSSRPTLLLFAHPKCPCTRASIEELNRLLTQCRDRLTPHVVFFSPEDAPSDWPQTGLWESARAIPGVLVETDAGGKRAQRFGAATSGYVVVYHPHGELLFKGGITAGRGHAGDNDGVDAILSVLSSGRTTRQTRVFGCAILNPERVSQAGISLCTGK
jgi:hypothetical protein